MHSVTINVLITELNDDGLVCCHGIGLENPICFPMKLYTQQYTAIVFGWIEFKYIHLLNYFVLKIEVVV